MQDTFSVDLTLAYKSALRRPDKDPNKSTVLSNLGNMFLERFDVCGEVGDIDHAVSAQDEAVRLTPEGHSDKPEFLTNLGISLLRRFEVFGEVVDIHRSISSQEAAIEVAPDNLFSKSGRLSNLGHSYMRRFERLGDVEDIHKAVSLQREAVEQTPDSHPKKPICLGNFGNALLARFECLGDIEDINHAVSAQIDAVELTADGREKPIPLNSLGTSLRCRFERLGDMADLDRAIAAQEDGVQLTPHEHPNTPAFLTNLGNSFLARFEHSGKVADIDKAIAAHDDAVQLLPDGHSTKPSCFSNLGNSLHQRFERLGDVRDVDKAISAQDHALRLTPEGHPNKPLRLLNLGISFVSRFRRLRDLKDIDKAASAHNEAVRLTANRPDKPIYLNYLGISLRCRFEFLGDVTDINNAVSSQRNAVQLTLEDHPDRPGRLSSLGNSLQARFERLGNVKDIDDAVSFHDAAVRLTPGTHHDPNKPGRLNNLGLSLVSRFERLGEVANIEKAILAQNEAVRLTADDHPEKPNTLTNLSKAFLARFKRLGHAADLNSAIHHSSCAARSPTGPALARFHAALLWSQCAFQNGYSSGLDAYSCALDLLPRVAWLGLPMAEQHKELANIGNIVRDAATAAIAFEKYNTALEWLEQGRSIVWGEILHLRTPIDNLRTVKPALADRIAAVSAQLEHARTRETGIQTSHQPSMEQLGRHHRELALEWDSLVESARAVPGFEGFLRPKPLSQLRTAARSGPVVVINVQETRCDALILLADQDNVTHVSLDRISYDRVDKLQLILDRLLSSAGVRVRSERGTMLAIKPRDEAFRNILSVLWTCVVKPVLERLTFPMSPTSELPRIWWCPTGPLTFLPLHAAGLYNTKQPGTKISDVVTSSYTPTLTALIDTPRTTKLHKFQLLAITQPSTPGQTPLPNTRRELILIQKHTRTLRVRRLEGVEATVERVVQGMKKSNWVHLACHGQQNTIDPTKSSFILQDGRLELSEIIKMSLSHADFAFLSACQTATGDRRLMEEAVHLAAGLLLAGYRGVIATTWSIKDNDAPFVADEVYARLFKDGQPDHTRAAHALQHAVQLLREQGAPFHSWIPFIHVGL